MTFSDDLRAGIATIGLVVLALCLVAAIAWGAVMGTTIDVVCATLAGAVVQGLMNIAKPRATPEPSGDTTTTSTVVKKTVPPPDSKP